MKFNRLFTVIFLIIITNSCSDKRGDISGIYSAGKISFTGHYYNIPNQRNILGDKIIISGYADSLSICKNDKIVLMQVLSESEYASMNRDSLQPGVHAISNSDYFIKGTTGSYWLISQNLADSNLYGSSSVKSVYRFRHNNFEDDSLLNPLSLATAYRNYKVNKFDPERYVYIIKPIKEYTEARSFIRLIKFDAKGRQTNNITINDFSLADYLVYDQGYVLALNNFGHGASRQYFRDEDYSYKIVWLDFNLNFRGCFYLAQPSTQINGLGIKDGSVFGKFELHQSCDICENDFLFYNIYFNSRFQPLNMEITKRPGNNDTDYHFIFEWIKSNYSCDGID